MWTADLCCADGLVRASQTVPPSIKVNSSSSVPAASRESAMWSWCHGKGLVTLPLNPEQHWRSVLMWVSEVRLLCCVPSCRQAPELLQLTVLLCCPQLWWSRPLNFTAVSCHLKATSCSFLLSAFSHFTALICGVLGASRQKTLREKSTALGKNLKLVTKIYVKPFIFLGANCTGSAKVLNMSCWFSSHQQSLSH